MAWRFAAILLSLAEGSLIPLTRFGPCMVVLESRYNPLFVLLSVFVAIFASYVALDLAMSVTEAKGRRRAIWVACGALAMGTGIWSMHFVGMLALHVPGVSMAYDVPLMILSYVIAIFASALALFIVSRPAVVPSSLLAGGIAMAAAIAGMHYTGMYSMRMPARIAWNPYWITISIAIALFASFAALLIATRLRRDSPVWHHRLASVVMGLAISGMHYAGMTAATFLYSNDAPASRKSLLATSGLGAAVVVATAVILGLAWVGAVLDRAFSRRGKKVEESARRYLEAKNAVSSLREERELRDRFVSALAHDLRTPLAAARITAQLTARKSADPDEVQRQCARIMENLRRMDQMIQDLLDAHRISAGQALPLKPVVCSLRPVLEKSFEDLATIHGDRFVLECDADLEGRWDPAYLQRAVENLCANAVKYGEEGSPIEIRATSGPDAGLVVSVRNRGNPIRAEDHRSLFDLFHRGKGAEAAGKRGWGLGLTIVKGIAEAHGGRVRVESDAVDGTVFSIDLPSRSG
jgi:NO-binding membrane sensor protein with MHYT domain/two-component sensor histidine kinase